MLYNSVNLRIPVSLRPIGPYFRVGCCHQPQSVVRFEMPAAVSARPLAPDIKYTPPTNLNIEAEKNGRDAGAYHQLAGLAPRPSEEIAQQPRLLRTERLFKDKVFSEDAWSAHLSFRRFLPEPVILVKVFVAVLYPVVMVTVISVAAGLYEGLRPESWPTLEDLDISLPYNICSLALSLLLVFKTNTSYARYWEARIAWGRVYVYCRSIITSIQAFAPKAPLPHRQMLLRWTIALPYIMRTHLLNYKPGSDSIDVLLTADEVNWLRRHSDHIMPHQPLRAVTFINSVLAEMNLSSILLASVVDRLDGYATCCGICERISRTPIPLPYARHTTRFLLIYTAFLPLALWRPLQWATLFVAPMLAMVFAGIENIGIQIENPIRTLPMASFCGTVHNNLLAVGSCWASGSVTEASSAVKQCLDQEVPEWQQRSGLSHHQVNMVYCLDEDASDLMTEIPAAYKTRRTSARDFSDVA